MKPIVQYVIDQTGNKTSVLVPYDVWLELNESFKRLKKEATAKSKAKAVQKTNKTQKTRNGFGTLEGKVWMADDFNAPLDDFKDYM